MDANNLIIRSTKTKTCIVVLDNSQNERFYNRCTRSGGT